MQTLRHRFRLPANTAWVNYLRCHDDIGWTFDDRDAATIGIDAYSHRQFPNDFYTGQFPGSFAPGVPFQENLESGDMRISGTMAWLAGWSGTGDRGGRRRQERGGDSTHDAPARNHARHRRHPVAVSGRRVGYVERLRLREHILGYLRIREGHRLIVLANFSEEPQQIYGNKLRTVDLGRFFQDVIGDKKYATSEPLVLESYQILWLKRI